MTLTIPDWLLWFAPWALPFAIGALGAAIDRDPQGTYWRPLFTLIGFALGVFVALGITVWRLS